MSTGSARAESLSSMSSLSARGANRLLCRLSAHTLAQDLLRQFLTIGDCFHGVCSQASCSWAGVSCLYASLCLSKRLLGRMKENFRGLIYLGGFANSATPCDCMQRAIGRESDGGWSRGVSMGGAVIVVGGLLSTLGSCCNHPWS